MTSRTPSTVDKLGDLLSVLLTLAGLLCGAIAVGHGWLERDPWYFAAGLALLAAVVLAEIRDLLSGILWHCEAERDEEGDLSLHAVEQR